MTPHGSKSTYSNHRCRCDLCRAAWAAYIKRRRQERVPLEDSHGRLSTYLNYGCRCTACREARHAHYAGRRATPAP